MATYLRALRAAGFDVLRSADFLGLIRVDLKALDKAARAARLIEALTTLGDQALDALVTVEPRRTRLRKLAPPA